ncbi:MAG: tRNA uridine-5-carboxymethylaminomethyl(34) synthesis GTPase MnmE [Ruminiclostridium sp.]|nr:tRNA uridine-5-carboxymethylaminomethyl(34) synthesis GTPase MnmE [Ruminiclostridium sp.]
MMSTIAAIGTPHGKGGVAMIRISGEGAFEVAERIFVPTSEERFAKRLHGSVYYGAFRDEGGIFDDGICILFRSPSSFTGENVCELYCHGGLLVTQKLLSAALKNGARMALPGEFTRRAFINGKMSLTEAEAVIDLINAGSEQLITCAKAQSEGALYRRIEGLCEDIIKITSEIAVWIDYPDESEDEDEISRADWQTEIGVLKGKIDGLLETYDSGQIMREGITAAIAGKPNAGKSTLMNLLTGVQKSIVTDIEGTTRDIVEETVMLGDIILHLSDCAGIRETTDTVENIGVQKMLARLDTSQLILALFDSSKPLSEEDYRFIDIVKGRNVIPVINKSDLDTAANIEYIERNLGKAVTISAKNGEGLDTLENAVREKCNVKKLDPSAGFLANERQRQCALSAAKAVDNAYNALLSGMTADVAGLELETALSQLYELSGKSASEEVIARIFERFCVGK